MVHAGWHASRAVQLACASVLLSACLLHLMLRSPNEKPIIRFFKGLNAISGAALLAWCVDAAGAFGLYDWRAIVTYTLVIKAVYEAEIILITWRISRACYLASEPDALVVSENQQVNAPAWLTRLTGYMVVQTFSAHLVSIVLIRSFNRRVYLLIVLFCSQLTSVAIIVLLTYFGHSMIRYIKASEAQIQALSKDDSVGSIAGDAKRAAILTITSRAILKLKRIMWFLIPLLLVTFISISNEIEAVFWDLDGPYSDHSGVASNPDQEYKFGPDAPPYLFILFEAYVVVYTWKSSGSSCRDVCRALSYAASRAADHSEAKGRSKTAAVKIKKSGKIDITRALRVRPDSKRRMFYDTHHATPGKRRAPDKAQPQPHSPSPPGTQSIGGPHVSSRDGGTSTATTVSVPSAKY